MRTEFMMVLKQLAMERNLPPEVVLRDLEAALQVAFRKESSLAPYQDLKVSVHPITGEICVLVPMQVVEKVTNPTREISLQEARKLNPEVNEGDVVEVELKKEASRVAVQLAKQTLIQRLGKTEEVTVFEEFHKYEGGVISGTIQGRDGNQIWVDLGQATGILPPEEQMPNERYEVGKRLRFYVLKVRPSVNKGCQIVLSRSHKNLLSCLFRLEVPEISQGKVEIRGVAREAGSRSKVAVATNEEGIDPVGSCIGPRGIRVQNIMHELNGERVDIVSWEQEPAKFIANALSPAQVIEVKLRPEENTAEVVIPDNQFSLAIGKDGQNARLAAKLTRWRIDIKPASLKEREVKAPPQITEAKPEPVAMEVKAKPPEAAPKERVRTIEELLSSIQTLTQRKAELKPVEEPLSPRKEEKKKKKLKVKKIFEEGEEGY